MPKKGDYINTILKSNKTVFSIKDISLLWNEENPINVKNRLNYYVRNGKLIHLRRGIYAKDKEYNRLELATKIYTPSYISFETVLSKEGVIFQFYKKIFIASYLKREIEVEDQVYSYQRMKNSVLLEGAGLKESNGYYTASKERAFLDTLYIRKEYHFDNLSSLDWEEVFRIVHIYNNKNIEKKVKEYYSNA